MTGLYENEHSCTPECSSVCAICNKELCTDNVREGIKNVDWLGDVCEECQVDVALTSENK